MALRHSARTLLGSALVVGLTMAAAAAGPQATSQTPLKFASARVSIAGTSNIHAYTASTTAVRITRVQLAAGVEGPAFWDHIVKAGAIEAFEIAVPAASLSSPKQGLDKNMHKALKASEHADITFRLLRLEPHSGVAGRVRGIGVLRIAGVEREVALDITIEHNDSALVVRGQLQLLMTDYGINPPTAMLGMLKTDPKVTVSFETVLTVPLT